MPLQSHRLVTGAIKYVIESLYLDSPVLFTEIKPSTHLSPNHPQERRKSCSRPVRPTCSPCPNTEVVWIQRHRKASLLLLVRLWHARAVFEPAALLETIPSMSLTLRLLENEIRISWRRKVLLSSWRRWRIVRDLWYVLVLYSDITLPGRHGFSP